MEGVLSGGGFVPDSHSQVTPLCGIFYFLRRRHQRWSDYNINILDYDYFEHASLRVPGSQKTNVLEYDYIRM